MDGNEPGGSDTRSPAVPVHVKTRTKALQTALIYVLFFGQGMAFVLLGPTLPELEIQIGATTEEMAPLFTWRSLGALIGVFGSAFVYDNLNPYLILGLSAFGLWGTTVMIPQWYHLVGLSITVGFQGFFFGCISVGASSTMVKIWGAKVDPFMQCLHFIVMVGAAICPLILKPFLHPAPEIFSNSSLRTNESVTEVLPNLQMNFTLLPVIDNNSVSLTDITQYSGQSIYSDYAHAAKTSSPPLHHLNSTATVLPTVEAWAIKSNYQKAYYIVGFYLHVSAWALVIHVKSASCKIRIRKINASNKNPAGSAPKKSRRLKDAGFLLAFSALMFLYDAIEETYGGLIMTFVLKELQWSKQDGATLTTIFWASNAALRAIAIVLSKYISPLIILGIHVYMVLLSTIIATLTYKLHTVVIWVCTFFLGAGLSALYAHAYNWANSFLKMTGRKTSVFAAGMFFGSLTVPSLTGYLFDRICKESFLYVCVAAAIVMFILFHITYAAYRKFVVPRIESYTVTEVGTEVTLNMLSQTRADGASTSQGETSQ